MKKSVFCLALRPLFAYKRSAGLVSFPAINLSQRRALWTFLVAYLIFALAACSAGASPTQPKAVRPRASVTASEQPTPTALPKGTILYQANWSHGLAGWRGTAGWKAVGGQLLANSLSDSSITAPYMPVVPNYAIETRIQIARVLKNVANSFNIFASKAPGKDGYEAGVLALALREPDLPPPGFAQAAPDELNISAGFLQIDYVPGSKWHTYRVEVQGSSIAFYIDGTQVSTTTSLKPALSNGPLGLTSMGLELRVSSFSITAL